MGIASIFPALIFKGFGGGKRGKVLWISAQGWHCFGQNFWREESRCENLMGSY